MKFSRLPRRILHMIPLPHALREGFPALRANPLRTLLSTLGVVMGVGSLTSVLALGDGMEAYARSQIESTTDLQAVAIDPVTRQRINGVRLERSDWPTWSVADARALQAAVPQAVAVGAQLNGEALVTRRSDTVTRGSYVIGRLARPAMYPQAMAAGRDSNEAEERRVHRS